MSEPEPYGLERAAAGKSLLFAGSGAAVDSAAESFAGAAAVSSLLSLDATGTGLGATRTARGSVRLCSTDKLSRSTTAGALLAAACGGSLARSGVVFTTGAGAGRALAGSVCGF